MYESAKTSTLPSSTQMTPFHGIAKYIYTYTVFRTAIHLKGSQYLQSLLVTYSLPASYWYLDSVAGKKREHFLQTQHSVPLKLLFCCSYNTFTLSSAVSSLTFGTCTEENGIGISRDSLPQSMVDTTVSRAHYLSQWWIYTVAVLLLSGYNYRIMIGSIYM